MTISKNTQIKYLSAIKGLGLYNEKLEETA